MKNLEEMLLREEASSEIVIGNTAVARGMIEAGIRVVTSYPGSPTPEIASAIKAIAREKRPFYFEFSTNEKVATEVAFGASINGHTSCVFFKSVGLNVASDSFVQLSLMPLLGGMVVVLGDDPGANSSQNEQDNRHFARMSYTPILEPSTPQEAYEMFKEAVRLSKQYQMPVILRLTTHVCHYKAKVHFAAWKPAQSEDRARFDPANGPYIPITSRIFPMKRRALKNLEALQLYAESCPFTRQLGDGAERGVISMGLPYYSLRDCLEKATNKPDILKLGMVYPLPKERLVEFLSSHQEVKVLEELDDVLEQAVKSLAYDRGLKTKILGKTDLEDWMGEYTPAKVWDVLKKSWPDLLPERRQIEIGKPASLRPAQLCPGCGHRSAFFAIKRALGEGDITVADIGCHTLGFLSPYNMGQVLLCMGHSLGTAAGLSLFTTERRVVGFIGDSTLFHAGMPGIINALFNKHNVTLIVMENGTTAMTGHQNHPGTNHNFNEITERIPIRRMLEGLGVRHIWESDTYNQKKLSSLVEQALHTQGFKVIIARHPCMLKFTREKRAADGFKNNKAVIAPETCEHFHTCVSQFGCPSFQIQEDGSVLVNHDLCIGDGSCVQTCAALAISLEKGDVLE